MSTPAKKRTINPRPADLTQVCDQIPEAAITALEGMVDALEKLAGRVKANDRGTYTALLSFARDAIRSVQVDFLKEPTPPGIGARLQGGFVSIADAGSLLRVSRSNPHADRQAVTARGPKAPPAKAKSIGSFNPAAIGWKPSNAQNT